MNETRERSLWLAVILAALEDLRKSTTFDEAKEWIFGGSQDFEDVCAMGGVEADSIRARAEQLLPAAAKVA